MARPGNLLVLMSDEHNPKMLGCSGHPLVATPHIDALARRGTRFSAAYCNNPVCVPARAVFATGRYNHQIGFWDNADAYDGSVVTWHHRLREAGHRVVSVGKLHFRSSADDNGFSEEIVPMHVIDGKGDLMGLVRENLPRRGGSYKMAKFAAPGESSYTFYDRDIAARAQVWLREEAPKYRDKPWALFVSFVSPHFPLTAPPEHFYRYYLDARLPWPKLYDKEERPSHPYFRDYAASFAYDEHFESKDQVRRAVAGYLGLCSFMDEQVGKVVRALEECGLAPETRILYTSDHGDNVGARGLWGKSNMFEEVAGVPLVLAGPDVPAGRVCPTPVTHVDVYPTVLEAAGLPRRAEEASYPGTSLLTIAQGADERDRIAFSEYHGMGSTTGAFMLRRGRFKYVHYVAYPPQLFELESDPEEVRDLAADPAYRQALDECRAALFALCDPAEVDARAKRRQAELLALNGGREAVIARGDFGFSPPPGVPATFD
jgi:choline-sulfatase